MKERKAASWASRESREEGQEENRGTTGVSPEPQARKGRGIGPKKTRAGEKVGWRKGRRGVGMEGGEVWNRLMWRMGWKQLCWMKE